MLDPFDLRACDLIHNLFSLLSEKVQLCPSKNEEQNMCLDKHLKEYINIYPANIASSAVLFLHYFIQLHVRYVNINGLQKQNCKMFGQVQTYHEMTLSANHLTSCNCYLNCVTNIYNVVL